MSAAELLGFNWVFECHRAKKKREKSRATGLLSGDFQGDKSFLKVTLKVTPESHLSFPRCKFKGHRALIEKEVFMKRRKRRLPKINLMQVSVYGEDDIRGLLPDLVMPDLWCEMKGEMRGLRTSLIFRHPRIMNEIVRFGTAASCPCCKSDFRMGGDGARVDFIFDPEASTNFLRSDYAVSGAKSAVTFDQMEAFCAAVWDSLRADGCVQFWDCAHFRDRKITHEMHGFVGEMAGETEVKVFNCGGIRVGFLCQFAPKKSKMTAEDAENKRILQNCEPFQTGRC